MFNANEYGGVPPVTWIVQPAYAEPCVPPGQDVVVIASAPCVLPLELPEDDVLPLLLVEEPLVEDVPAPLEVELLPEPLVPLPLPQALIAMQEAAVSNHREVRWI